MLEIPMVCIIDDDLGFHYAVKRILESTGRIRNIIQFGDGEDAINYFLEHKEDSDKLPDIVFLDIRMPCFDGWQFLNEFSANHFAKKITVYICTSSISLEDQIKYNEQEIVRGYLTKPVANKTILEVLDTHSAISQV